MLHKLLPLASIACLATITAGCGDLVRQDRTPVLLVIDALVAASGASTTFGGTLQSDVLTVVNDVPSQFSDNGRVTMRLVMKDNLAAPSPINAVTINRYRVTFRRADGRNTPGVDVPYPFDSAVTFTVAPGTPTAGGFELIRHVAKSEAPLLALVNSAVVISTIAEVTFYGRDQAGNDISATGTIGIQFGNFADPN
jgi:hypothetical protein